MNFLCKLIGHRLETAFHTSLALYCSRCKTIIWVFDADSGLILNINAPISELKKLGIRRVGLAQETVRTQNDLTTT